MEANTRAYGHRTPSLSTIPDDPGAFAWGTYTLGELVKLQVLTRFKELKADRNTNAAVAAIHSLTEVIKSSKATTMMEMEKELKDAARYLQQSGNSISVASACELFIRFVTRTLVDIADFAAIKAKMVERGELFTKKSRLSRGKIGKLADRFIHDGMVVLTHGFSRVVLTILQRAAQNNTRFSVLVTETRPECLGYKTVCRLTDAGIPVTLITDAAVGHVMATVDLVLVGAEGVVENGGIINSVGTFQMAIVAQSFQKPFYVGAESFKFTRLYPLGQSDLPDMCRRQRPFVPVPAAAAAAANPPAATAADPQLPEIETLPARVAIDNPALDYTPPSYITLLFTDLGVLTPAAISDELIKLYYY